MDILMMGLADLVAIGTLCTLYMIRHKTRICKFCIFMSMPPHFDSTESRSLSFIPCNRGELLDMHEIHNYKLRKTQEEHRNGREPRNTRT